MSKPVRISLVYFEGCPHLEKARGELGTVFEALGTHNFLLELIDTKQVGVDASLALWPSPTVLVNGQPVCGETPTDETSCHVFDQEYWAQLRAVLADILDKR